MGVVFCVLVSVGLVGFLFSSSVAVSSSSTDWMSFFRRSLTSNATVFMSESVESRNTKVLIATLKNMLVTYEELKNGG